MKKKRAKWVEPKDLPEWLQGWRGEAWYNGDEYKGPVIVLAIRQPKGEKTTASVQFPNGDIRPVAASRLEKMPEEA